MKVATSSGAISRSLSPVNTRASTSCLVMLTLFEQVPFERRVAQP
jgi:hypothetical protein